MSRVLVIDGSQTVREMIRNALEQASPSAFELVEATNAEEAVERFRGGEYHLVFLDLVLGEERTVELLGALLDARPGTRIVLVTSVPRDDPDVVRALGVGAYAFVEKPVRVDVVKALLMQIDQESGFIGRIPPST